MRPIVLLIPLLAFACAGERVPGEDIAIGAVQGAGERSPWEGRSVRVTGVVTASVDCGANRRGCPGGFFLQSETPDGDPATSDGLFVEAAGESLPAVRAGERVRVSGTVAETGGETRLVAKRIETLGQGAATPAVLRMPAARTTAVDTGGRVADLEHVEGMLVRVPQTLTVTDLYDLGRYGEVGLAAGGRVWQYTSRHAPDAAGLAAHREASARRRLIVDDGSLAQNPLPVPWLGDPGSPAVLRVGDTVQGLAGVIRYGRAGEAAGAAGYRLVPVGTPAFAAANPRPAAPPKPAGAVRVMALNAHNFFGAPDRGRPVCGPARDATCRGADSDEELRRQLDKLVSAIAAARPDIAGLTEVENDDGGALAVLVRALRDRTGRAWSAVETGPIGTDAIRVALIFDAGAARPAGNYAVLNRRADPRFLDSKNRPVLAQAFTLPGGRRLTVAVVHLKAKGSDCDDLGDPDAGDGQGNCNGTRTRAARALADWLSADPAAAGSPDALIVGDMNAYALEDPVRALREAGWIRLGGGTDEAYTFVFRGETGALDHAFASPALAPRVLRVTHWHVNADEPGLIDYNREYNGAAYFDGATPYRASDHDPLLIDLDPGLP